MTEPNSSKLELAPVLDMTAVDSLHQSLKLMRGSPVEVDAAKVERSGALCMQILLSAAKTWKQEGVPFQITAPSESFNGALKLLGIDVSLLAMDGAAT